MVTLKHPAFGERVTVDVDPECVKGWLAQGWKCCGGSCADCPEREPDAHILPVDPPKPGPRRKTKTPSVGDDEV